MFKKKDQLAKEQYYYPLNWKILPHKPLQIKAYCRRVWGRYYQEKIKVKKDFLSRSSAKKELLRAGEKNKAKSL